MSLIRLTELTDKVKKQLTKLSNAFQKGRDGLKQFVVGDRKQTFGLIGEWIAPPTYKADGTIDASAISSGIQQDSILEYLGEAKDSDGNVKLLAAVSTVRGWINSSKPNEYKNENQAGQENPAKADALDALADDLAGMVKANDGEFLVTVPDGVELANSFNDGFLSVAMTKVAGEPNENGVCSIASELDLHRAIVNGNRAAMRAADERVKELVAANKARKADDDAKAIAKADAKSLGEGKDGRPYNLEDARVDRDKAKLETA